MVTAFALMSPHRLGRAAGGSGVQDPRRHRDRRHDPDVGFLLVCGGIQFCISGAARWPRIPCSTAPRHRRRPRLAPGRRQHSWIISLPRQP